jgi:hypothetical protein
VTVSRVRPNHPVVHGHTPGQCRGNHRVVREAHSDGERAERAGERTGHREHGLKELTIWTARVPRAMEIASGAESIYDVAVGRLASPTHPAY